MRNASRITSRCLAILSIGLAFSEAVHAEWDTTLFEVELHRPLPFNDDTIQEIEAFLHETAELLEQQGFRPSTLGTTEDGQAYRIHVIDKLDPDAWKLWGAGAFVTGNAGAMTAGCSELRSNLWVPITSTYFDSSNKIESKLYQDLAHELFHTVQYNYKLFNATDCTVGAWITEGTAEAIGIHAARVLRNVEPYTACQMGVRSYDSTLYIKDRDGTACTEPDGDRNPYNTKSFWRFLGEYDVSGELPKATNPVEPVYDYLALFFEKSLAQASPRNELRWLDSALDDEFGFGFGLEYAFPSFSASFADYWRKPRRSKYPPGLQPSDPEKTWIELIFGDCKPVHISLDKKAQTSLKLPAVSAGCIEATFDAPGPVNFDVFAHGTGHELKSLSVGTAGGGQRVRAEPYREPSSESDTEETAAPPERVRFGISIDVPDSKRLYLIVSNVNERAERTNQQTPHLEFVLQGSESSLDSTPPNPNPASPDSSPYTDSTADKEIAASFGQFVWLTSADPDRPIECTPDRPGNLCGPTTSIRLTRSAATTGLLGHVVQPGVSLDRKMEVLGYFQQRGMAAVGDLMQAQQAIQSIDGSEIRITIPRIDYGYTGSVSNASISVSRAVNDGNDGHYLKALGPSRIGDCNDGYYPHSGRVTIEEATPFALRGTYSAELIDPFKIGECTLSSLPVVETISGRFSISEPGLGNMKIGRHLSGDRHGPGLTDEELVDQIWQQTNEMVPGLLTGEFGDLIRAKVEQRLRERAEREAQTGQSSAPTCECNCYTQDSVSPACQRKCEPFYRACEVNPELREYSDMMRTPTDDEQRQIEELRRRYEMLLNDFDYPDEYRETLLKTFDKIPGLAMKKQIYDSLGSQKKR